MSEISVSRLKRMRDENADFVLLDVREADEVRAAHLDGSLHIPMGEIQARASELPKDKPIAVFCHSGFRSEHVARFLRANGFEQAVNVAGGIEAWSLEIDAAVPRY